MKEGRRCAVRYTKQWLLIPTCTNTHSRPSPDSESGNPQGLLNSFTPRTPTKKDHWGQPNQQSNTFLYTNLYLSHYVTVVALKFLVGATIANVLFFFLMLLYLVTAHITGRQRRNCLVSVLGCCSVIKSCPTLWLHGLQHVRLPCPSLSPGVCSNSCPLSQWSHSNIPSSVAPSLPGLTLSQQEDLFQWVDSSNQVAKVLVSVTGASIYTPTNSA